MNVYTANYYRSYGYGACDEYDDIIVANSESEALGFALEHHPDSRASSWNIHEIDTSTAGVVK